MKVFENIEISSQSYPALRIPVFIFFILLPAICSFASELEDNDTLYRYVFSRADSLAVIYMEVENYDSYHRILRKANWAASKRKFNRAAEFYKQAIKINPEDKYPHLRLREMEAEIRKSKRIIFFQHIDFEKSPTLILVLILITIFSGFSMIVLLLIILFHRNQMERRTRIRQDLKEKYQNLLMDYLFDEEELTEVPAKINKIAANRFRRVILVEEMQDLIGNLSGDASDRLRELYYKLNLEADSRIKALSNKWHIKIKGFRELAFMNIRDVNQEIIKTLHSKNSILRMEAQLALVRLDDNDRFGFLDQLQRPFTMWEQMNLHQMIISHNLEVPDFQRWLDSSNRSVAIFALRMIKVFKQKSGWQKIIALLDSSDNEVRKTAIYVLGELRIRQAAPYLKHHYKNEVYENLLEIVIALGKIADHSVLRFLVMVIDKEDDVQLQIEAARALRDMGEEGENSLQKLMNSDYKNYQIIIKHVLDKRI